MCVEIPTLKGSGYPSPRAKEPSNNNWLDLSLDEGNIGSTRRRENMHEAVSHHDHTTGHKQYTTH
eukprot:1398171-Heterocapsa_arctica.AAC.1